MKKALKKSGLSCYKYQLINLNEGNILSIDSHGKIETSEFEMSYFTKGILGNWYTDYYSSEHDEILFEMCSCFGVSEDDVRLLLDFGYPADEIEEMLMDTDLITETVDELKSIDEFEDILEYCL